MPSDGDETRSAAKRWVFTNDLLAAALVLGAIAATGVFVYRGEPLPVWLATVDALAVTTAVVWTFGRKAFTVAKKAVMGNDEDDGSS